MKFIYGDKYYEYDGDYILEDDLEEYAKKVFGTSLRTAEV